MSGKHQCFGSVSINYLAKARARVDAMCNCVSISFFKTSLQDIQLVITLNVMFLVSLKNVEDLLHERGMGVNKDSVLYWQHRHCFQLVSHTKQGSGSAVPSLEMAPQIVIRCFNSSVGTVILNRLTR